MKKFLISAAAIAALATSAMAFDVYPTNEVSSYVYQDTNNTSEGVITAVNSTQGQALIFPLFYVGNGWQSQLRVINTSSTNSVVAKVVLYSAKDSKELKDFNIYLSANDEWIGKIVEEDGKYYLESTDGSSPLKGDAANPYPMASADNPLKVELPEGVGYVQVIGMGTVTDNVAGSSAFHNQHSWLREAYNTLAKQIRSVNHSANATFTFSNGVVLNKAAIVPYVDLANNNNYAPNADEDISLSQAPAALTGDVRVTNTLNGTDMVYGAKALDYNKSTTDALVYLEGEKANLADIDINSSLEYNGSKVIENLVSISPKTVYMTYGDTQDVSRNYALLTIPFKRIAVQEAIKSGVNYDENNQVVTDGTNPLFYGVSYDGTNKVINYGSVKLLANIYNTDEAAMSAGQFSPATTPTIVLSNEVSSTGTDVNDASKLPYYLKQAQDNGFTNGYVKLNNLSGTDVVIPGIVSQMIATDAGNAVVTNWFTPAQN